jgi:hypothetical protein
MQQDEEYIIEALGITDWSEDKREPVVIEATMRIGTGIVGQLSEQQYTEYKAIVDDNQDVIDAWLDQNIPDYKDNEEYRQIAASYDSDPEKNNPNKLFATIAWVQVNVPNLQQIIDDTLTAYRQELASA